MLQSMVTDRPRLMAEQPSGIFNWSLWDLSSLAQD